MTEEVMQLVEEDTDWASKKPAAVGWRIKEITGPMFARTPLKSPLNQKLISTIEVACLLYHLSMRFDAAAAFTLLAYQQLVKDRRQALTAQITEVTMAEGLGPRDGELLLTYYGTVANRGEGQRGRGGEGVGEGGREAGSASGGGGGGNNSNFVMGGPTPRFPRKMVGCALRPVMTDAAAAILRAVMMECYVSQKQMLGLQAMMFFYITGCVPTPEDLRTRRQLNTKFKQLHEKDRKVGHVIPCVGVCIYLYSPFSTP